MFIKVGWIYKFGNTFPFAWWSLYWFVLDQLTCSLTYYKSPKNPKRKGSIQLDGNQVLLTHDKLTYIYLPPWLKREHIFGILTQKKNLTLCCYYVGETDSWLEVIDMFRPELFDKRMDAAEKISKCMQFNNPYKKQQEEFERARKAEVAKNVLESHLPVHSRIYGFKQPPQLRRPVPPPQPHVPMAHYFSNVNINPNIVDSLKSLASRAYTMLTVPAPAGSGRHGSISERVRGGEDTKPAWPCETQINDIMGALTSTTTALNGILTRQQQQDAHIQNLQNIISEQKCKDEN